MTQRNRTATHTLATAAILALVASACGSTTTSNAGAQPVASTATVDDSTPDETPTTEIPVSTDATPDTTPATDAPVPSTDVPPETTPGSGDGSDETTTPDPTCGDFGAIPPVPDSMPTMVLDTDGDGPDDEVTAYGAADGWVLRVVENDVISEASIPDVMGWAFISNTFKSAGRDVVEVTDNDLGTTYIFSTVDGCVELLEESESIDDVTIEPLPDPAPAPTGPSDFTTGAGGCGDIGPDPDDPTITSELFVDLAGDGTADDHLVTYFDGTWTMRSLVAGVVSEVDITGVGPGSVRALGLADVGELTAGPEIIATVGAGASVTRISVFGVDESNCLFRFVDGADDDLAMTSGATIGNGSRFSCGPGYIAGNSWTLQDDDTYSIYGAAYIESSAGQFTYMPASDDYNDGLTADELPVDLFDCNGLSL